MNPIQFVEKWKDVALSERSAYQQHFLDLCDLCDHPKPVEVDPTGDWFTFERGAEKQGGGDGWADVWKREHFGWEYKKRRANLGKAYQQLLEYREALENPPLLVVCDTNVIEVHTNFENSRSVVHRIELENLPQPRNLRTLRAVFHQPGELRPTEERKAVTETAARQIGDIAKRLRDRGEAPHAVARFLDRLVFCMFAEDIRLLPDDLFSGLLAKCRKDPGRLRRLLADLFGAMTTGGDFGSDEIQHFNGALFTDAQVLDLTTEEIGLLAKAAELDWSVIDPSIFGTLFERGLDPAKRGQLGAHYTSREDIELLVEPVVLEPLRREWHAVQEKARDIVAKGRKKAEAEGRAKGAKREAPWVKAAAKVVDEFRQRLSRVKVLDPACGSGNFLFVTLQKLMDLEQEVIRWAAREGLGSFLPLVHPRQLHGIEVNEYAAELAQMSMWIGYLQWIHEHGHGGLARPILEKLSGNFRCGDAILETAATGAPGEPRWPNVDYIVGNPPFLGGKLLRRDCGDAYVDALFAVWDGRVPREADLCCYWFEKARAHIERGHCRRAGLLATQGIRGGANREVLERILRTGGIYFAESDREWVLDGANVHISMVGFDDGSDRQHRLDGKDVPAIRANLGATAADITTAKRLPANAGRSFMGDTKGGDFDIPEAQALEWLHEPNPHGEPNSTVLVPWVNGKDITSRTRRMWIVDFGCDMSEADAARFEKPFEHVRRVVQATRHSSSSRSTVGRWWQHERARPEMRARLAALSRFMGTPTVSKHRLFVRLPAPTLPDHQLIVFAVDGDFEFGVLQSRAHEAWALRAGTRLETRPRYTPNTCFETFPFPAIDPRKRDAISRAAADLDRLREAWLNPPEWTREDVLSFPGSIRGPWAKLVHDPDSKGVGTVRYSRRVPADAKAATALAKRTLTRLYNERPTWLVDAHRALDEAVFAAFGWPADLDDDALLVKLLELNAEQATAGQQPLPTRRRQARTR